MPEYAIVTPLLTTHPPQVCYVITEWPLTVMYHISNNFQFIFADDIPFWRFRTRTSTSTRGRKNEKRPFSFGPPLYSPCYLPCWSSRIHVSNTPTVILYFTDRGPLVVFNLLRPKPYLQPHVYRYENLKRKITCQIANFQSNLPHHEIQCQK